MQKSVKPVNKSLKLLSIDKTIKATKIQKCYRGYFVRSRLLPLIMYSMQKYLKLQKLKFIDANDDGRVNSSMDEDNIIQIIVKHYGNRIKKPNMRMWYDILAFDYRYGWIPINIKTTTTQTSDNTGNLAMCVYAYTNIQLDLDKSYENGKMSVVLVDALKSKKYNILHKKDYYFLVLNKTNANDVIVNSVKGLTHLTPNINNLPFQVNWAKNRLFTYGSIREKIELFIHCLKKPKPCWREIFMADIRTL
jgi:hypothetical protein